MEPRSDIAGRHAPKEPDMATIAVHTARWNPQPVAAPLADRATRILLPPREVWPLLVTTILTWLLMLGAVAWYATGG